MKISEELQKRGFIHQYSAPTLAEILDGEPRTLYHGIDPSADSAHAGNFVNWMLLHHLVKAGHSIIFLVGGGTGRIGDPKPDVERSLKSYQEIDLNVAKLRTQAEKLFSGYPVTFVNNNEWLSQLQLIDFLRDIGKHFTINELIKKDAIATRLQSENGLSYTEFAYPLLQGYDYLELYRRYGCTLQVGGSDQWGNMVAGIDLIRRLEQATAHVLTVPLVIDKITGKKFGKSEGNAVWLDPKKTRPYDFYQFWFNTDDGNVEDYLKLFTTIPLVEIEAIMTEHTTAPQERRAQKRLAVAITTFVHGAIIADSVALASTLLFGDLPVTAVTPAEQAVLLEHAPVTVLETGTSVVDALIATGVATSKREARQFIADGAIQVQYNKITDESFPLTIAELGTLIHLKRGKKQVVLISLTP
jgi:tyrosyl-tRNA synthetase